MNSINIFLLGLFLVTSYATQNKTQFIATEEWQEIQEGQPIPQGLHVRINLQTGMKEAKLLEKEDNNTQSTASLSTVPGEGLQDHGGGGSALPYDNIGKLKEALENIPGDDFKFNEEELKKVNQKYKTYEQIKQELKEVNLEVKSDSDIMGALFERFEGILKSKNQAESTVKAQLDVMFEDLLYLVHQIDNAIEFIDRQGIEKIIWPSLNQTESSLKIHGFKLLGTVVQNNPKAKVALFERNGGSILLTKLSQSSNSEEISAGLYAFGALLRKFPYAQSELLNPHGYSLLFDVLDKKIELRVKVKIVKLITDLVQDYEHATTVADVDAITRGRYESTQLKEHLRKVEYCKRVGDFFHQNKAGFVQDDNLTEEVVSALRSVRVGLCQDTWSKCPLFRHTLLVLRNNLDTRLSEWSGDTDGRTYLKEIQQTIDQFVEELYVKEMPKDEL
ncbi:nucleotide exchange factor Sil1 [Ochlerotatus camptorhynchus]|uniref:nucleotide exchange factor Sil1 n=1 Tax=Ochlerotatus camptorhynchus TaxID=644619 RepID=UPI0031DB053F